MYHQYCGYIVVINYNTSNHKNSINAGDSNFGENVYQQLT